MRTSKSQLNRAIVLAAALVLFAAAGFGLSHGVPASADGPVFLTRVNKTITTYPRDNAFSVGSTTNAVATSSIAKLNVTGNANELYANLFEVASTTTAGGTATSTKDIFKVTSNACFQVVATSTATPVKLTFNATTTQGATNNGVLDWAYGTCNSVN